MSEYCKSCGTHISEDDTDTCRNCSEISRLEQELTRLKTPRTCGECMWINESYDDDVCFCPAQSSVVYISCKDRPWLCGHFQPKKEIQ